MLGFLNMTEAQAAEAIPSMGLSGLTLCQEFSLKSKLKSSFVIYPLSKYPPYTSMLFSKSRKLKSFCFLNLTY